MSRGRAFCDVEWTRGGNPTLRHAIIFVPLGELGHDTQIFNKNRLGKLAFGDKPSAWRGLRDHSLRQSLLAEGGFVLSSRVLRRLKPKFCYIKVEVLVLVSQRVGL